ncbi:MAG: sucrose synthase [Nostocaceae cyanobacterium]|nr:sucrose synthase [Nostocaceae cyanobacterium]
MHELLPSIFNSDEKTSLVQLLSALRATGKHYFLRNEILQTFSDYCQQSRKPAYFYHSSALGKLINYTHEIILESDSIWLLVRPRIAFSEVWRMNGDLTNWEMMTPKALLDVRDKLVNRYQPQIFEIDISPFYDHAAQITDPRNIGQGLAFLNRYLCNQLVSDPQFWVEALYQVLEHHHYGEIPLLIGDRIHSGEELCEQVHKALKFISERHPEEPYEKFHVDLQEIGFEPGWGNTASRVRESLELLDRLIDNPEPAILEAFVTRIPAFFNIVLVSVHGWVGQEDVLGRTETGGQVVYVLDQARSLDKQLCADFTEAGLDFLGIKPQIIILTRLIPNCEGTNCHLRLEKVEDAEHVWILRVPLGQFNPNVTQNWMSKYEIWPYLESFAANAEEELLSQLGGRPHLIVGNYSDGNLVAFLLARRLGAIQCNIAHSLEKPKNLFSDLHWQDLETQYNFSVQFTADLIGMNAADFIITSSYQEIVGTPDTMGQYESYKCFTMPNLYHVVDGIDLFSPKFNTVPPGVNEKYFFPYTQTEQRDESVTTRVRDLLFTRKDSQILGTLANPNKRPIYALAPINSIKNLTGLAECFAKSPQLQEECNLILVTGKLHPHQAANPQEALEVAKLHAIIEQYQLHDKIRWVGMRLPHVDLGEAYRVIAEQQGIFVHFARFEAFGLTILEAMISGLPTFATKFGGSIEIVQDEYNGFLINPTDLEGSAAKISQFLLCCQENPQHWQDISQRSIARVRDSYNWKDHTKHVLLLAKISAFWNYVYRDSREALLRYVDALFHLIYKPRAEKILEQHIQR